MASGPGPAESEIEAREQALRAWFTRDADPVLREVDGLDIGWGGTQRWATGQVTVPDGEWHLDFACAYGTLLAQLGWRLPRTPRVGLNIDFAGPHAQARALPCCMPRAQSYRAERAARRRGGRYTVARTGGCCATWSGS